MHDAACQPPPKKTTQGTALVGVDLKMQRGQGRVGVLARQHAAAAITVLAAFIATEVQENMDRSDPMNKTAKPQFLLLTALLLNLRKVLLRPGVRGGPLVYRAHLQGRTAGRGREGRGEGQIRKNSYAT